jgi:hypothetical protein
VEQDLTAKPTINWRFRKRKRQRFVWSSILDLHAHLQLAPLRALQLL